MNDNQKGTRKQDANYDQSIHRLKDADGYAISGESEFSRERSDPYEMVDYLIDREVSFKGKGPRGFDISDQKIYENVCEALASSMELDASDIDVEVMDSTVTLKGSVEDENRCHLSQLLVQEVAGVTEVVNELKINNQSSY